MPRASSIITLQRKVSAKLLELRLQEEQEAAPAATAEPASTSNKVPFAEFCELIRIVPTVGSAIPLRLNRIQALFHIERTGRDIILKPRQVGITTLEAARDLWTFLCVDGARVVIVCQSTDKNEPTAILSGIIKLMIESLRAAGWRPTFLVESRTEWMLANGNTLRIIGSGASAAAAVKKGRAGTITRLHITEMAFFEFAQKSMTALLACVPPAETGSEIVVESTPNGAHGLFYDWCQKSQAGQLAFKFHFYRWFDEPRYRTELAPNELFELRDDDERRLAKLGCTAEQLKWRRFKRAEVGDDQFDQEFAEDPDTCFLISGRSFFDKRKTEALLKLCREPLEIRCQGRIRIFRRPDYTRHERYLLAIDPSEGTGGDPGGGYLLDVNTGEHCATIDGQFPVAEMAREAAKLAKEYRNALIVVERNNHGYAVHNELSKEQPDGSALYSNVYVHVDDKEGWPTNQATRPVILDGLEDGHRTGVWNCPDKQVLMQMRTFVIKDGKPQAAANENDDLVLAAAIAWQVRQLHNGRVTSEEDEEEFDPDPLTTFGLGGYGFG